MTTTIKRTDLLADLQTVTPALSASELIPVLTHYNFTSAHLRAYNDMIGLQVPCKTAFEGAVPNTLVALLKASRAVDVVMTTKDGELHIKAASSKLKLPLLPPNSFVFDMPKPKPDARIAIDKSFMVALECCMRSVSRDMSIADQLGITCIPQGNDLFLFSTNGATISHARVRLKSKATFKRVVLPGLFCEQLLKLSGENVPTLEIHDDYAFALIGGVSLFGRLIQVDHPLDFVGQLKTHMPDGIEKKTVPIPSKMQFVLERAAIIMDTKLDRSETEITVKGGEMSFYSKSKRGEAQDSVQIGEAHPNVKARITPRLLKDGYGHFERFLITDRCAIMTTDDLVYMVAALA